MESTTQQFNDGIMNIYKVGNIAEPGNMPKDGLVKKINNLRYQERTVGIKRNSLAKQEQSSIEQLLRIPRIDTVTAHDIVILRDNKQYKIYQIQQINDTQPKCLDLSLERIEVAYDIARN